MNNSAHQHQKEIALKTIWVSIFSNLFLAILKGVTGILSNSFALIADAIESSGDVLSSILVLLGLKYANRPADENHPYGHGKAEALFTFIVVGFLLISATTIAYQSVLNIITPHELPNPKALYILFGIVLFKEINFQFVIRRSKKINSSTLKADAWHHRSDAITSIFAILGISISTFLGKGYEAADDWAALGASIIIIYNAYLIFRPALGEIMDENLYHELIEEIRAEALKIDGVINTEKCFVRKNGMFYQVDLHISVDGDMSVTKGHDISHEVKDKIMDALPQIANVLIHIEPEFHH